MTRPLRNTPDQKFLRDVVELTQHPEGDDWYRLLPGDGDGPIGLMIKVVRSGDHLEIVEYTTFNA